MNKDTKQMENELINELTKEYKLAILNNNSDILVAFVATFELFDLELFKKRTGID